MKILVTGGAGFIGQNLIVKLLEAKNEILIIDQKPNNPFADSSQVQYLVADIRSDSAHQSIIDFAPQAVYHLAAEIRARAAENNPADCLDVNVIGSIKIFEAAKLAGAKTVILASTTAVYGPDASLPFTESVPAKPVSVYGHSKLSAEFYLNRLQSYGITTHALRFANVYGPHQDSSSESGAVAIFTTALLNNQPVKIHNDGLTTRDYLYIADLIDALIIALTTPTSSTCNLGTGQATSTLELFDHLKNITNSTSTPTFTAVADTLKHARLDTTLAQSLFNWKATTSLPDGLKQTVAWYQSHS